MAVGYFLRVGDKTTCGGQILTGDNTMQWYGVAGAREGDMVSCGEHSGRFYIIGGCNSVWDDGRKVAGTLESISSCPCHARFIHSIQDCYSDESRSASMESTSISPPAITNKICISCLMKAAESGQMLVVREG
ncbi:Pyocin large subunit [Providencia rustigianii]|nr:MULTISPECIES: PAAR domain-containing protein [Providencia]MTC55868.1 PAAR domain-containing protein [Providencia rustigianii]SPY79078.1 Pyocin large subunit [Providencia rustigianii]SUC28741.1 Pyocin large subunit [Providencia rustigianii]SUC37049.1 Pyocin large subunit [Providencia rustigianii]VEB75813.1 Pyocin large subunit [Providencia rustigianii]